MLRSPGVTSWSVMNVTSAPRQIPINHFCLLLSASCSTFFLKFVLFRRSDKHVFSTVEGSKPLFKNFKGTRLLRKESSSSQTFSRISHLFPSRTLPSSHSVWFPYSVYERSAALRPRRRCRDRQLEAAAISRPCPSIWRPHDRPRAFAFTQSHPPLFVFGQGPPQHDWAEVQKENICARWLSKRERQRERKKRCRREISIVVPSIFFLLALFARFCDRLIVVINFCSATVMGRE